MRKPTLSGSLFCHKEPFLCFAPPGFANEFKNAKFIHIFRDGRDNADSMVRTYSDAFSDVVLRDRFLIENKSSEVGLHRDVRGYCVPWWVKPDGEEAFLEASQFGRYIYMWREMTLRAQALRELGPSRYLEIRYEDFVERPSEIVAKVSAFLGRDSMKSKTARTAFKRSVGISARRQDAEKLNEARQIAGDLLLSLGYQTADSMTGNECIEEKMGIACPTALG